MIELVVVPLALFAGVGLVGSTVVRLARAANERAGVELVNGERRAASLIALLCFLVVAAGMVLAGSRFVELGGGVFAGGVLSSFWGWYFRTRRGPRGLLD